MANTRRTTKKIVPTEETVQQASPEEMQHEIDALKQKVAEKPVPTDIIQPPVVTINPLMEKIRMPGQTYQIPSQGLFYNNGELDDTVENGEVHVYPMTTIDEIVIRTPDMLFSGDSIEQVFRRCIPSVLKPKELFAKDVDFLMVCLRQVSYGEQFEVSHTHDCKDAKSNDYMIMMKQFITNTKQIDPTTIQQVFHVPLDNGQVVDLLPIKYTNLIKIMQVFEEDITPEMQQDRMIDTLSSIIKTVDGISDKPMIEEWLAGIPIKWAKQLSNAIDATTDWGPDFTTKVKCKDCGKQMEITIPMNPVSFFT